MRRNWNSTFWVFVILAFGIPTFSRSSPLISLQDDGSLVVADSKGSISDFVKQGTPRQSIQIGGQSCNVSYGFNSAGKKTVLMSVPAAATAPVVFTLGGNEITIPSKSALRMTLGPDNRIEKMDGNPTDTVRFNQVSTPSTTKPPPPLPTQVSPVPTASSLPDALPSPEAVTSPNPVSAALATSTHANAADPTAPPIPSAPTNESGLSPSGWPGKLLESPIPASQMEEDQFYARTEFGPRFVSSMNFVSVTGPNPAVGAYNQKEIAFSTGYRQDLDLGVWLTDWFGLALETGFALNAVRGNTEGMTVSSTTYWTIPLLAQLCFQYPNESGWIPYINFGFGGAWTLFKVGGINYFPGVPQLSGTGNAVTNAYQIAAGVRYRLYEELSITLAYKFFGNSQANINLDNGVQATLGSPVTNSAELGVNFSF